MLEGETLEEVKEQGMAGNKLKRIAQDKKRWRNVDGLRCKEELKILESI